MKADPEYLDALEEGTVLAAYNPDVFGGHLEAWIKDRDRWRTHRWSFHSAEDIAARPNLTILYRPGRLNER